MGSDDDSFVAGLIEIIDRSFEPDSALLLNEKQRVTSENVSHASPLAMPGGFSRRNRSVPRFLKRKTLVLLLLLLFALFVVLQILDAVSAANRGLASSNSDRHYLWTYGPSLGTLGTIIGVEQSF